MKVILTTSFLKIKLLNGLTDCKKLLECILTHNIHSSINDYAPKEAEKHEEDISQLNLENNVKDKTVSDLHSGDKVRKFLITNATIEKELILAILMKCSQ